MFQKFDIQREVKENAKIITLTVPTLLEPKEWYWLKEYGIKEFDSAVIDWKSNRVILKVSTTIYNTETEIDGG